MNWTAAKQKIQRNINIGTDINTSRSTYREIKAVNVPIVSNRYGYSETGFILRIGKKNNIKVPWSMLKNCFHSLSSSPGYDGAFFRSEYSLQAKDHPCHVHAIGQIFVAAGIARTDGKKYLMR